MVVQHDKRCGFNLVEAAIVLGVVSLVIGGIWVAAAAVQQNLKLGRMQEQILMVVENFRNVYGNQPGVEINVTSMGGILPKGAWSSFVPQDMVGNDPDYPVTPWNTMFHASLSGGVIQLQITMPNIATCASLAPRIAGSSLCKGVIQCVQSVPNGMDLSTPITAADNCKSEFDNEGHADLAIQVPQ